MKKDENNQIPYSVLKQDERKIETVTEKPKKSHRRGYAWFLGIISLLGVGVGIKNFMMTPIINTTPKSNLLMFKHWKP